MKTLPLEAYASNPLGIATMAADYRQNWKQKGEQGDPWDIGFAAGHQAAFSTVLRLILGTDDERLVRAKLFELYPKIASVPSGGHAYDGVWDGEAVGDIYELEVDEKTAAEIKAFSEGRRS